MKVKSDFVRFVGCVALAQVGCAAGAATLPEGYVALDYVRPHGSCTQWVETNYRPLATDRIEMTLVYDVVARQDCAFWCARSGHEQSLYVLNNSEGNGSLFVDCGNGSAGRNTVNYTFQSGVEYTVIQDCNARKFIIRANGAEVVSQDLVNFADFETCGSTLTLFASHTGAGTARASHSMDAYRLKAFKVTDKDGNVQVDMTPAYNTATCRAGLYDRARDMFVSADAASQKNLFFRAGDAFGGELPPGIRSAKWVTTLSNGTLLRTFIRPDATDTFEAKVSFADLSRNFALWASRNSDYKDSMTVFYNADGTLYVDCGDATTGGGRTTVAIPDLDTTTEHLLTVNYNTRKFSLDGVPVADLSTGSFTTGGSWLTIFGSNRGNADYSGCDGAFRLHSFRILGADGSVKHAFVPCLETASSCGGLYDTVEGSMHIAWRIENTNTLDYDLGLDELSDGYTQVDWLRAPGKQWINTGFTPRATDRIEMEVTFDEFKGSNPLWTARTEYTDGVTCFVSASGGRPTTFSITSKNSTMTPDASFLKTGTTYLFAEDCKNGKFFVDAEEIQNWTFTDYGSAKGYMTIFAGGYGAGSTPTDATMTAWSLGAYRISSVKVIGQAGNTRMNLVPCVRDADGKPGFYDLGRDRFLVNSSTSATGDFETAPVVRIGMTLGAGGGSADFTFAASDVVRELYLVGGTGYISSSIEDGQNVLPLAIVQPGVTSLTGVCIPYKFRRANPNVRAFLGSTARCYVQDGLVYQLDAVESAGRYRHIANGPIGNTWAELVSGNDAEKGSGSFAANYVYVEEWNGKNTFTSKSALTLGGDMTVEFYGQPHNRSAQYGMPVVRVPNRFWFGWDYRKGGLDLLRPNAAGSTKATLRTYDSGYADVAALESANVWRTYTAMPDYGSKTDPDSDVFVDGVKVSSTDGINAETTLEADGHVVLGGNGYATRLSCVRIYNRKLTQAEIDRNRALDQVRFGGAQAGGVTVVSKMLTLPRGNGFILMVE